MRGYPPRFLSLLWTVCGAVLASGLLLLPTTLDLRFGWAMPWRLPGDARLLTAAVHAGASFAMLLVAGALWSVHMRAGWRRGRQRKTGAVLVTLLAGLALSALGVYYLGESGIANGVALIHVALGLSLALPLGVHTLIGRRQRARQQQMEAARRLESLQRRRAPLTAVHPTQPPDAGARHRLH